MRPVARTGRPPVQARHQMARCHALMCRMAIHPRFTHRTRLLKEVQRLATVPPRLINHQRRVQRCTNHGLPCRVRQQAVIQLRTPVRQFMPLIRPVPPGPEMTQTQAHRSLPVQLRPSTHRTQSCPLLEGLHWGGLLLRRIPLTLYRLQLASCQEPRMQAC